MIVWWAEGEEKSGEDGVSGLEEVERRGVDEGGVFEEGGGAEAAGWGGVAGGGVRVREEEGEGVEGAVGGWGGEVGGEGGVLVFVLGMIR